jgi:hypothetical protein
MENTMYKTLMNTSMKPYGKLSKLLYFAYHEGIISEWEFDSFEKELSLLVQNQNRSHNTIPRDYIEKELDRKYEAELNAFESTSGQES